MLTINKEHSMLFTEDSFIDKVIHDSDLSDIYVPRELEFRGTNILMRVFNEGFHAASNIHRGQLDKSGAPYIEHLFGVAQHRLTASFNMLHMCVCANPCNKNGMLYHFPSYTFLPQMEDYFAYLNFDTRSFITHCIRQCCMSIATAWMHDSIEDHGDNVETRVTVRNYGGQDLLNHVKKMTKPEDVSYYEYVHSLFDDKVAICCKYSDLLNNSDEGRLFRIADQEKRNHLKNKYKKALSLFESISMYMNDFGFIPETIRINSCNNHQ